MPRYQTVIPSTWEPQTLYAYMADFSNAQEWDPGVVTARRLDPGDLRVGSQFDLTVQFAGGRMVLRYAITDLEAPNRVVFTATTGHLESVDTLSFRRGSSGSEMTYDADLRLKGVAALANPLLALGFRRVGDRARDSLRRVLTRPR